MKLLDAGSKYVTFAAWAEVDTATEMASTIPARKSPKNVI